MSQRTETDETFANPDGTFTVERALVPVRVRQNGRLVPVDTDLAARKDGRIAPKAAGMSVSFSGGGDGAFAHMVKDGREVSLTWPGKLPEPTVSGRTATYREVLPGVDLTATASVEGFSHALVVKTAEAAKNPALEAITFGYSGKGLDLKSAGDGRLEAVDPTGTAVFSAPRPQMWDSAGSETPAPPAAAGEPGEPEAAKSGAAKARTARSAPDATSTVSATTATASATTATAAATTAAAGQAEPRPLAETLEGATEGSRQAGLDVRLTDRALTLRPDKELLTDPETVFPVVIDPVWAKDAWKNAWSIAYKHSRYSNSADTVYWNGGTISDFARVGVANDTQRGGTVRANTYFRIATGNTWGKQILRSTLRIKQTHAGSWSCKSGAVQVRTIGSKLPTNITWNRQPKWGGIVDSSGESFGGRNCPADKAGLVEFDVTDAISKAAKDKWGSWAFVLTAKSSEVDVSWRKFDPNSVRVSTKLNTLPSKPTSRSTDPSVACTGGTFGTTDYITLRAKVNDAEDNNLVAEFHYAPEGGATRTAKVKASRGSVAALRIDARNLASGTYWWDVRASDGTANGPWAGRCKFTFDKTRPSKLPGVTSKEFPPDVDGNPARTDGTFVFDAGGVKDVTRYTWWTDSDTKEKSVDATKPGGPSKPVKYRPLNAGPQYMYVRSLDSADNRSDLKTYLFLPTRAPHRDRPGDLNGDGTVDLWTVDPGNGALWIHPGQGNGKFGLGRQADEASFGDAVMTHRGSWNEDYYEDLVALRPGLEDAAVKELWVYANRGDGELGGTDSERWQLEAAVDDANHWSDADQVLSIGSLNDDDGNGKVDENDTPDLLVRDGAELWLYFGFQGSPLIDEIEPVSLGNADWQNMTLLAPGDLNGDGLPELWARDTKSGRIHQYTSRENPVEGDITAADLAVYADPAARTTSIGSGFTGAAYPHLATNGDFEGDGFPDLWSRNGEGSAVEFPGRALKDGSAFGAARPLVTGGTPWGTCETFESRATGKRTLCGPILAKYKALGGPARFGHPGTDVVTAPDKIGRYTHFQAPGTTANNRSIYWSPETGAWEVHGSIWAKWTEMGREGGVLGYPTSDERPTSDGVGRFNTFSKAGRGSGIYYAPGIGAHEVHGSVYQRYLELGGPARIGYPVTDELATKPKAGAYQQFRHRDETEHSSAIYWSKATGAWPVHNAIMRKWESLKPENGWLGFPTSYEYEVTGGVRADFENGYVRWNRTSGTTVEHKPEDRTAHLRTDLAGDVDGDGRTDMITVYDYGNASTGIHVLTADEDGGVRPPREVWTSNRGSFDAARARWTAGDFNGDGLADVAAFYDYADGSMAMWTFVSQRGGGFKPAKSAVLPPKSWYAQRVVSVQAGDVNGDGRADLTAVYDYDDGQMGLHKFLAQADGTFAMPVRGFNSGDGNWWAKNAHYTMGDANGDGRADLIAFYGYATGAAALWTFPAKADGTLDKPVKSWNVGPGTWERDRVELTSGDYNGDKRADAAVMYRHDEGVTSLHTFLAQPNGGFAAPVEGYRSGAGNWYASSSGMPVSGDADGDGRADVLIMYNYAIGATRAFTFPTREDGTFENPRRSWYAEPGTW
ncbi:FG-GAP-like repeat-containing protein [Streptomyces sp. TRM68416]|uniref:FG-GAP-like repeat-containing protein n=1 Tax=Streptomyces sp. TRM68416 TaxID=2758412 RepID=UPI0016618DD2|nr:FG-GAP-like repeat-containing protein [Streptomyces sp. TRM68416]MBD0838877.1 VCBS repeat-containing protein [Streptomyces sp. TRM68416]